MTERYYRPELDVLRFFAFSLVFCSHLPFRHPLLRSVMQTGMFGVPIFFLLSAFLIITLLLRELDATGTVRVRAFAMRRALRIWPLYFFALTSFYIAGRIWPSVQIPIQAVLAFSVLAGNVYILLHGWVLPTANALWSLSVEEQFYAAVPALVRFGGRSGIQVVCWSALVVAYGVLTWLGIQHASPMYRAWPNSFVQFQFFAMGGILALALHRRQLLGPTWLRLLCWSAGMAVWVSATQVFNIATLEPSSVKRLDGGYLAVLIGTIMIFLSFYQAEMSPPGSLVYLGKISYGLYIFHQFWIWFFVGSEFNSRWTLFFAYHRWFGTGLALVATGVSAALSYRFLELPMLRLKHRYEIVRSRPD